MQTFLPYADFELSAQCLDTLRLGKQRVEALQIRNALQGRSLGWRNHPATQMWRGYIPALELYRTVMILEWLKRGYVNTMEYEPIPEEIPPMPPWMGNEEFHLSHRSNLLRKHPVHYARFGWDVPHNLPYVWPILGYDP